MHELAFLHQIYNIQIYKIGNVQQKKTQYIIYTIMYVQL